MALFAGGTTTASAWMGAAACPPAAPFDGSELKVGSHPAGASPSGIEDVLLAPAELLAADDSAMFNACSQPNHYCAVFGLMPGAIDSVEPFLSVTRAAADGRRAETALRMAHAYAFRCVLDDQSGG
jgi:hypothetical protein